MSTPLALTGAAQYNVMPHANGPRRTFWRTLTPGALARCPLHRGSGPARLVACSSSRMGIRTAGYRTSAFRPLCRHLLGLVCRGKPAAERTQDNLNCSDAIRFAMGHLQFPISASRCCDASARVGCLVLLRDGRSFMAHYYTRPCNHGLLDCFVFRNCRCIGEWRPNPHEPGRSTAELRLLLSGRLCTT